VTDTSRENVERVRVQFAAMLVDGAVSVGVLALAHDLLLALRHELDVSESEMARETCARIAAEAELARLRERTGIFASALAYYANSKDIYVDPDVAGVAVKAFEDADAAREPAMLGVRSIDAAREKP